MSLRDLGRLIIRPRTGVSRIAQRYLRERIAENSRKYPNLASFSFDYMSLVLITEGRFEDGHLSVLASKVFPRLVEQGTCLDIGANIGNHSLFFSQHFSEVVAIEPHPRTYRLLQLNSELAGNIVPINAGCSDRRRTAWAIENPTNIGGTSISAESERADEGAGKVRFELYPLDDMEAVNRRNDIGFVKIDIEGHEMECLEGATDTLKKHKPVIALEVSRSSIHDGKSAAVEYLKQIGYGFVYEIAARGKRRKRNRELDLVSVEELSPKYHDMVVCSPYRLD